MVVEPFEFDEQGPQPVHRFGNLDAQRVLDREAVRQRMTCGRVAADALGQFSRVGGGPAME